MIKRLGTVLARAEDTVVVLFATGLVVLAGVQVFARLVLDTGFSWIEATASLLVLWLTVAGAVVAARQHQHLGIDVLSQGFAPGTRRALQIVISLFAGAVCLLMAYASWELLQLEREAPTEANALIPGWIKLAALPVGFALMGLHYLLQVFAPVLPPVHAPVLAEEQP